MKLELTTKFSIGQRVFYIEHSTSYEEIPCTHCNGNYREIVNNIEYTCPHCKGGREKRRKDSHEVQSGVITNIRIALYGEHKTIDGATGLEIETNIKYNVTKNRSVEWSDDDGNSLGKYEGELYADAKEAIAVIGGGKITKIVSDEWR